jgi:ABC-2 type transport system ATP-binding protein
MAEPIIEVSHVSKKFKTYEAKVGKGLFSSLRRRYYIRPALRDVDFSIKEGEIVAILGLNGSGKSTLMKIIIGILYPDKGTVKVLGANSWSERDRIATHLGVVLGAHGQLYWDLPPIDTFNLMKHIYRIPDKEFSDRLNYFVERLNLKSVYKRQVRQLSLGEQMKCNFVASVLHQPKIVILDEPTIGVDLPSKSALRETIHDMQKNYKTTFLLTTHIVDDITIAKRIVILDKGKIIFNGVQNELLGLFGNKRMVELALKDSASTIYRTFGKVLGEAPNYAKIEVAQQRLKDPKFIGFISGKNVTDYNISEPELTEVLLKLYTSVRTKRAR